MLRDSIKGKISILEESTTNFIDAYKILGSPALIAKELIENSMDAGSTTIKIVFNTKFNFIEVIDNGKGISSENLKFLCKRFNSTKITDSIEITNSSFKSYGFRGEALSILSHLSLLSIQSRSNLDVSGLGFSGIFQKGECIFESTKDMDFGTQIKADKLYFNNEIKRSSLDSKKEVELLVKIVQHYSIHFPKIGFTLVNANISTSDVVYTTINQKFNGERQRISETDSNILEHSIGISELRKKIINSVLNEKISADLLSLKDEITTMKSSYEVIYTKPSSRISSKTVIAFVNDRIILKNSYLKSIINSVYDKLLIKGGNLFCYIAISITNENIDYNCHADKSSVIIRNENELYGHIESNLLKELKNELTTANFYSSDYKEFPQRQDNVSQFSRYPKDKIRVDCNTQQLETCLKLGGKESESRIILVEEKYKMSKQIKKKVIQCFSTSLYMSQNCNPEVTEIMKKCFLVGVDREMNGYIQHNTSLYLLNVVEFIADVYLFFYVSEADSKSTYDFTIDEITLDSCNSFSIEEIIEYVEFQLGINEQNSIKAESTSSLLKAASYYSEILELIGVRVKVEAEHLVFMSVPNLKLNCATEHQLEEYYHPFITYSILKCCFDYYSGNDAKESFTAVNGKSNLHFILETLKILCYFQSQSIPFQLNLQIERKESDEILNKELNSIKSYVSKLIGLIKVSNYSFRSSYSPEFMIQKLTDTETLYTVFERC